MIIFTTFRTNNISNITLSGVIFSEKTDPFLAFYDLILIVVIILRTVIIRLLRIKNETFNNFRKYLESIDFPPRINISDRLLILNMMHS